ncbi:MAG: acyl-CoA dehydrogenase family protein [Nitrososphaera sp.]|jgi:alkylation response protein AidB-like acyl-CoA dehydrogenase
MASGDSFRNISSMSFGLSAEQESFLEGVRAACERIRPAEELSYLNRSRNMEVVPVFGQIGMLGCPVLAHYGGLGYDMLTYCLALELVGQVGSSLRTFFSAHTSIGQLVLQAWGNDSQRTRLLPETTTGEKVMAFALTEPAAGSDPAAMKTRYEKRNGSFVLTGKKHWIGNGTFARIMTTYAKDVDTGRISSFIIERDEIPEPAGQPETNRDGIWTSEISNKVGLHTVKNAEVNFKNFEIPADNLLGEEGQGLSIAYSALIDGRLSVAAGAIGVMRDCLEESVKYSKQRIQHGSELARKQLIQEHIARMAIDIESSRWLVYRAAAAVQKLHDYVEATHNEKAGASDTTTVLGRSNTQYSALRREADYLSAVAKFHASNCSFECANRAVQIFGSAGYTLSASVARHFLDSRATIIYEGANEVLELKIASSILGEGYSAF